MRSFVTAAPGKLIQFLTHHFEPRMSLFPGLKSADSRTHLRIPPSGVDSVLDQGLSRESTWDLRQEATEAQRRLCEGRGLTENRNWRRGTQS